jgi:hypothetical protein
MENEPDAERTNALEFEIPLHGPEEAIEITFLTNDTAGKPLDSRKITYRDLEALPERLKKPHSELDDTE